MSVEYRALGSAGEVGASSHFVRMGRVGVMLDAGAHPRTQAAPRFGEVSAADVQALVLSHAHLDHVGTFPLARRHFRGVPMLTTAPTRALADLVLRDHLNRSRDKPSPRGLPFEEAELDTLLREFTLAPFEVPVALARNLQVSLHDAGHLLGSAGVLLESGGQRVYFSGDVHLQDRAWMLGAEPPVDPVDVLLLETTQGANPTLDGVEQADLEEAFIQAVEDGVRRGGYVLVPTFALGRAQELIALLLRAQHEGRLLNVPVAMGGLAQRVNTLADTFAETVRRPAPGRRLDELRVFPLPYAHGLYSRLPPPAILLAGSGMMSTGSAAQRLAQKLLPDPENTVIFVGYTDGETPGDRLKRALPGSVVDLGDGPVKVRATLSRVPFSAHAAREDLVALAEHLDPRHLVLIHGDEAGRGWLAETLAQRLPDTMIHRPLPGQTLSLQ